MLGPQGDTPICSLTPILHSRWGRWEGVGDASHLKDCSGISEGPGRRWMARSCVNELEFNEDG